MKITKNSSRMKNVTFISAGAGSGKTYTLTEKILKYVAGGGDADQIILTTYTNVAADELKEKVRIKLYEQGYYEAASHIDNAAIGTIHSIAFELVRRYWYLLGINANSRIMSDEDKSFYLTMSLASLPSIADYKLFNDMAESFNITNKKYEIDGRFWMDDLREITERTSEICLDDEALSDACQKSKHIVREILSPSKLGQQSFDENEILSHLDIIIGCISSLKRGKPEKKREYYEMLKADFVKEFSVVSKDINVFPVRLYANLSKSVLKEDAKGLIALCPDSFSFFEELGEKVMADYRTYNVLALYIDTIFRLVLKWREQYTELKREKSLLDYNDVLGYFYKLLCIPQVQKDLSGRYKIALVDEFQDCSPLQVKIFSKLSEYMEHSYWVGDVKQAIYEFRGSNTLLIESLIGRIEESRDQGNSLEILDKCWRSNKTIINAANTIFCNAFRSSLTADRIKLEYPDKRTDEAPEERELRHWHFYVNPADDRYDAMARQVKKLHDEEGIAYQDIALLYRSNDECVKSVNSFKKLGIPYNAKVDKKKLEADSISVLLQAIVAAVASDDNLLSKSIVVRYTEPKYTAARIISDRLRALDVDRQSAKKWLDSIPNVKRLEELRDVIKGQSIAKAIETIIVEFNIEDLIKRIDPMAKAYKYCNDLLSSAVTYESLCLNLNLDCSIFGFAKYLEDYPILPMGDDDGVVVSNYHKCKGLEWKCVILNSLSNDIFSEDKNFYGVQMLYDADGSYMTLIPKAIAKNATPVIKNRVIGHIYYKALRNAAFEEAKRIMYVGVTRPKELLITTSIKAKKSSYNTHWIDLITGKPMMADNCASDYLAWHDLLLRYYSLDYTNMDDDIVKSADRTHFMALKMPGERVKYPQRDIQPSKAPASPRLLRVEGLPSFAGRVVSKTDDDAKLGNCIHQLMCIYNGQEDFSEIASTLAEQYGVEIDVGELIDSITAFYARLCLMFGPPDVVERELPFAFKRDSGEIVRGEIDMVYRTSLGDIIVDYKTYQGASSHILDPQSDAYAGKYSGQIEIYEEALRREHREVFDRIICYISLGEIVRFEFDHNK